MPKPLALIVAYKMMLTPGFVPDESLISVPANYKDPAKIAEYKREKLVTIAGMCAHQPYTGTFEEVQIVDITSRRAPVKFPLGNAPIAVRVKNWLLKNYPSSWQHSLAPDKSATSQPIMFVGFDPKLFLKVVGIECSLPPRDEVAGDQSPAPLGMWFGNSDHRDIGDAVRPVEYSQYLPWSVVLAARKLTVPKEWTEPGINVTVDLLLATSLATQLGIV